MSLSLSLLKISPFLISSSFFLIKYPRYVEADAIYVILKCIPLLSLAFFVQQNFKTTQNKPYLKRIFSGLLVSSVADAVICSKQYFLIAVALFALVHVIYLSSFGFKPLKIHIAFVLAIIEYFCSSYLLPFIKNYNLKFILTGYVTFLFTMIWRSTSKVKVGQNFIDWPNVFGALGSILFGVSDIILCYNMFAQKIEYGNLIIMSTYYYAQAGIALSVLNPIEKINTNNKLKFMDIKYKIDDLREKREHLLDIAGNSESNKQEELKHKKQTKKFE